jgi:hypothetical protein
MRNVIFFLEDILDLAWALVQHPIFQRLVLLAIIVVVVVTVVTRFLGNR